MDNLFLLSINDHSRIGTGFTRFQKNDLPPGNTRFVRPAPGQQLATLYAIPGGDRQCRQIPDDLAQP